MTYDMNKCVYGDKYPASSSAANILLRKKNFREYYFYAINQ